MLVKFVRFLYNKQSYHHEGGAEKGIYAESWDMSPKTDWRCLIPMRKKMFLALLLVAAITLSGCSLVVKDADVDAKRTIIDVNGETVDKQTVTALVDQQASTQAYYYYYYYGYSIDTTDESFLSSIRQSVIDEKVEDMVIEQKIKEYGFDQFTDEELAEMETSAESEAAEMLETIKQLYLSDSELEGDALEAEAQTYAQQYGVDKDSLLASAKSEKETERLKAEATKDVTVTDEEVQADFDSKVESAKTEYESDLDAYGEAVNDGETVYYAPAGYRYVKQILVKFSDEDSTAIEAAKDEQTAAQTALTEAQTALSDNETALAAEDITDEEKTTLTEAQPALQTAVDEAQKTLDAANEKVTTAIATAHANLQPKVDEIMQKIADGEDFETLIETYNEDPGMTDNANGYAICAGYSTFDSAFVDAAMALENVGDVTEPVKSDAYGYYIIRYQADIAEGAVDISTVEESIRADLLSTKQDETYEEAIQNWIAAADVKTYIDRLTD